MSLLLLYNQPSGAPKLPRIFYHWIEPEGWFVRLGIMKQFALHLETGVIYDTRFITPEFIHL